MENTPMGSESYLATATSAKVDKEPVDNNVRLELRPARQAINLVTLIALVMGLVLIIVGAFSVALLSPYSIEIGNARITGESIGFGAIVLGAVIALRGMTGIPKVIRAVRK